MAREPNIIRLSEDLHEFQTNRAEESNELNLFQRYLFFCFSSEWKISSRFVNQSVTYISHAVSIFPLWLWTVSFHSLHFTWPFYHFPSASPRFFSFTFIHIIFAVFSALIFTYYAFFLMIWKLCTSSVLFRVNKSCLKRCDIQIFWNWRSNI